MCQSEVLEMSSDEREAYRSGEPFLLVSHHPANDIPGILSVSMHSSKMERNNVKTMFPRDAKCMHFVFK